MTRQSLQHLLSVALVIGCGGGADSADAFVVDAPTGPTDAGGTASADCLAGCAQFNDGASGCGVSDYDCDALCVESDRIGIATGCETETAAFWSCFAAAPAGAFCGASGVCSTETTTLDACVALAPSTECLRACVACGDSSYATCAVGCARRDGHAHIMGCDAEYQAYYACRITGPSCPLCTPETNAFTDCWRNYCASAPVHCPVTP